MKKFLLLLAGVIGVSITAQELSANFSDQIKTTEDGWSVLSYNFPTGNYADDEIIVWNGGLSYVVNTERKDYTTYLALNHAPADKEGLHTNALFSRKLKLDKNKSLSFSAKMPKNFSDSDRFNVVFVDNIKSLREANKIQLYEITPKNEKSKNWQNYNINIPLHLYDKEGYIAFLITSKKIDDNLNNRDFVRITNINIPVIENRNTTAKSTVLDKNHLTIYPNPAKAELFINATKDMKLKLVDASGKLATEFSVEENQIFRLDTKTFPAGIYYIVGASENENVSEKIIITNQ